jgi:hypothetical protein
MIKKQKIAEKNREMRQVERRHLVFYLRVFDGTGTRVLGHVVDISSKGVMLLSGSPISVGENFRMRMRLPSQIANMEEIVFNAGSRWCKPDVNPDFFIAGFEIRDVDDEIITHIHSLIEDFSFQNHA